MSDKHERSGKRAQAAVRLLVALAVFCLAGAASAEEKVTLQNSFLEARLARDGGVLESLDLKATVGDLAGRLGLLRDGLWHAPPGTEYERHGESLELMDDGDEQLRAVYRFRTREEETAGLHVERLVEFIAAFRSRYHGYARQ